MSGAAAIVGAGGGAAAGGVGLVALVVSILSMYFGWKIAGRKGRNPWLGLILGCFLSWIGLIIVAVLPRRGSRIAPPGKDFQEYAPPPRATQSTPPPLPPAAPAPEAPQAPQPPPPPFPPEV